MLARLAGHPSDFCILGFELPALMPNQQLLDV
jgi:hypothetical protein